jgi:hypothetical protein
MRPRLRLLPLLLAIILLSASAQHASGALLAAGAALPNPILFVAQVPSPATFATSTATFGNHLAGVYEAPRGGGLYIRYTDGSLKNLTAAAGYGSKDASGFQDASAIAVRDPAVSWDGTRALFSMVVGAPSQRYQVSSYRWQIYEVSGLGQGQAPVITKVPNQPAGYNNISPIYGSDDRIIFSSDRPRGGEAHLYPQFDEYELSPVNSGLWSLNPASGDLILLDHAPSGDFTPIVDSYGRVLFTRWDHLQRDQEADADYEAVAGGGAPTYGTFNYASEAADAAYQLNQRDEVFPEPRGSRTDLLAGTNLVGHTFNFFGPWQMNEDGSEAETLNHIGRQEYGVYADPSFNDDPNLSYLPGGTRANTYQLRADGGLFQLKESRTTPGIYYATNAREFATHAAGQIVTITGAPNLNADQMLIASITHPDTSAANDTPSADHSGLYRDPLPLSDGRVLVAHASTTLADENTGTATAPRSRYDFRLQLLASAGNGYQAAGQALTGGISAQVSYWSPDDKISYSGPLWELQPVELVARQRPARRSPSLRAPELDAFSQAGVDPTAFKIYLAQHNLALAVSRNVTVRDNADRQQPFNLRVPGGVQTIGAGGKVYNVSAIQFFQADMLRGKGLDAAGATPDPGRRVLAQTMHDPAAQLLNASQSGPSPGSVTVGSDGSVAAFVPARRAMTWQITDAAGVPVVRERIWVTFQPGEVRVCASCHGLNNVSQAGGLEPANTPAALIQLLRAWKAGPGSGAAVEQVYLPALRR